MSQRLCNLLINVFIINPCDCGGPISNNNNNNHFNSYAYSVVVQNTYCPSAEALAAIIIINHDIPKQTNSNQDVI